MLQADGRAAVADIDDDLLVRWKGHRHSRPQRNRPPVEAVDSVGGEIAVHNAMAANVGHQHHIQRLNADSLQRLHRIADDKVVSTALAERKFRFDQEAAHRASVISPATAPAISSGRTIRPIAPIRQT